MALDLKRYIAEVADYPKPGVSFKDLCPVLACPEAFEAAVEQLARRFEGEKIDSLVVAEARGFLWGGALAPRLKAGLIPARKPGKLPRETVHVTFELEYGTDELHIHRDALATGQRVLVLDDVLATGGTAKAMLQLVTSLGADVVSLAFIVELTYLKGRERLSPHPVYSVLAY